MFVVQTPVLGLGLGVVFTFAGDNHKNHKNENNNPHLYFVNGAVLGDKEQRVGIRNTEDQVLLTNVFDQNF